MVKSLRLSLLFCGNHCYGNRKCSSRYSSSMCIWAWWRRCLLCYQKNIFWIWSSQEGHLSSLSLLYCPAQKPGMHDDEKRQQTFHAGPDDEEKGFYSYKADPPRAVALIHQSEVKIVGKVIDKIVQATSVRLEEKTINSLPTLQKVMFPVCSLNKIDFCTRTIQQFLEQGKALAPSAGFVIDEPGYNIRRVGKGENSLDHVFAPFYTNAPSNIFGEMLWPGSQAPIFFSMLQSGLWYKCLVMKSGEGEDWTAWFFSTSSREEEGEPIIWN